MKPTKFVILYAEDDPDDLYLVKECFAKYSDFIEMVHAENGQEALSALSHMKAKGIEPCLIILDINMPVMDGRQALIQIKAIEANKHIPIVVFTTSSSSLDKSFAQKWGADFITKPLQIQDLEALAKDFTRRCRENVLKKSA